MAAIHLGALLAQFPHASLSSFSAPTLSTLDEKVRVGLFHFLFMKQLAARSFSTPLDKSHCMDDISIFITVIILWMCLFSFSSLFMYSEHAHSGFFTFFMAHRVEICQVVTLLSSVDLRIKRPNAVIWCVTCKSNNGTLGIGHLRSSRVTSLKIVVASLRESTYMQLCSQIHVSSFQTITSVYYCVVASVWIHVIYSTLKR